MTKVPAKAYEWLKNGEKKQPICCHRPNYLMLHEVSVFRSFDFKPPHLRDNLKHRSLCQFDSWSCIFFAKLRVNSVNFEQLQLW